MTMEQPQSWESVEALDGAERDPETYRQCSTAVGRIEKAQEIARRASPEFAQFESLVLDGRRAEITDALLQAAHCAQVKGHMLACLYYFGPMTKDELSQQISADSREAIA